MLGSDSSNRGGPSIESVRTMFGDVQVVYVVPPISSSVQSSSTAEFTSASVL